MTLCMRSMAENRSTIAPGHRSILRSAGIIRSQSRALSAVVAPNEGKFEGTSGRYLVGGWLS
jgi:hypothetical protein